MNQPAETIWRYLWGTVPELDEWWATNDPDTFVLTDTLAGKSYSLSIKEVPTPDYPPSQWADEGLPHPFGWEPGQKGGQE